MGPYWFDVAAFEQLLLGAKGEPGSDLSGLREAVELYTEDLLSTCYDEWLLDERERLRQRYLAALDRLVAQLAARGEHGQAVLYAERLVRHDPLREETYRRLMRLHDARGDRARALRTYHTCATTLERELGVEPSTQTREVYEALLPLERESQTAEPQGARVEGMSLVGRASERTRLTALWRATEGGRSQLALVTGEPGIGKTRLVEEFRSWCRPPRGADGSSPVIRCRRRPRLWSGSRMAALGRDHGTHQALRPCPSEQAGSPATGITHRRAGLRRSGPIVGK